MRITSGNVCAAAVVAVVGVALGACGGERVSQETPDARIDPAAKATSVEGVPGADKPFEPVPEPHSGFPTGCTPGIPCDDNHPCTQGDGCGIIGGTPTCSGDPNDSLCLATQPFCADPASPGKCDPLNPNHDANGCFYDLNDARCTGLSSCTLPSCSPDDPDADPATGCVVDDSLCPDSDGIACTVPTCDGFEGCFEQPDNSLCDDGNPCTSDRCGATGCVNTPVGAGTSCDDGLECTSISECNAAGQCVGLEFDDGICTDAFGCTDDKCDPADPNADPVTGCLSAPNDLICDDRIACTVEVCNPGSSGADGEGCVRNAVDTLCQDGLFCNGAEVCDQFDGCQPGTPIDPDDGVACTTDSCNETTDSIDNIPVNARCDDSQFCNGAEVCDASDGCQPGTPPNLNDGIACTVDSCNEAIDRVVHTPVNSLCSDGAFCNGNETCSATVGCQAGTPPPLSDGVGCTNDFCNEATDTIVHTPVNANCSDGQFCNGAETCDPADDCQPGTPPVLDDGVGCTNDSCDEDADVVVHIPDDNNCDDEAFCNGAETCSVTADCQPGTPPSLDDGVGCTDDSCDEAADVVVHTPVNANCDDEQFCNGAEICNATTDCQPGTPPNLDDGVGCTDDSCNEAADVVVHTPVNANCDDAQFCNGVETCDATLDCQAGTPPNLDDGVGCTDDSCDEAADVVVHTPVNANCDDEQFCNGAEVCNATADCQPGTPPSLDDGVGCTDDSCDEGADVVVHTPVNANCDDFQFCNGVETCDATLDCQPGTPPTVNDGVDCTVDACNEATDVVLHTPLNVLCDDGQFCNGAETCDVTLDCQPGTPPNLDDGVGCTDDSCDEGADVVVHTPVNANCSDGQFCNGAETCDPADDCQAGTPPNLDDGVGCTNDSCDEGADVVVHVPDDNNCDDEAFCNGAETCDATLDCQPGTPPSLDDGVGCTDDSCDEGADVVVHTPVNANCDDLQFCNGAETCSATADCQAGTPPNLDDGVGCTDDSCDEAADVVVHTPVNANCDDLQFCNGAETCSATADCQAGTPPNLDDGVGCTDDSCDEAADVVVHTPVNANCDDEQFCNGAEVCNATAGCQPGTPPSLDDGVGCTDDSCDEGADVVVHTPVNANCDDEQFCNGAETCDALLDCQAGTPPSLDDGVGCTDDSCDEGADVVVHTPVNANCDDLQFCNGVETCDALLDCQSGTAPDIDDGVACTDDSCNEVTDAVDNVPNNANCDDLQFCNGAETCDATLDCQAGTAPDIDDGVDCTDDSCNEVTDAIDNVVNDANCDDGAFCNGAETCNATTDCQPGTAPNPDDGVGCTDDSCDEAADVIVNAPNDGLCNDSQFCNGVETCDAVADCQAGAPPVVADGVGCTVDSCDEAADVVVNTPIDALCADGAFCNGDETCDATDDCQPGAAPAADDGVGCTDDSCDEVADTIVNAPNDARCDNAQFCDGIESCDPVDDCQSGTPVPTTDGVACTDDSCDEAADAVVNTPNDANCDDADLCTADFCDALGGCGSDPIPGCCNVDADCNDGDACTTNVCSGPGGTCSFPEIADCCNGDAECNDGDVCTVNTCSGPGGVCNDSDITGCCNNDLDCNDGVVCTDDACDLTTNSCVFDPIAACCTIAADCNDGNACTNDACDAVSGECSNVEVADCCNTDADCADGDLCTVDTCSGPGGFCLNAEIPSCCEADGECDDGDVCTADACNVATNRCEETDIADCCELDSECDDGDTCTADVCDLTTNTCGANPIKGCCNISDECDDGDDCTVDTCFETACFNDDIPGCGLPDAGVPDAGAPDAGIIIDAGAPDAFNGGGSNEDPADASTGGDGDDDDDDDGGCLNVSGQSPTGGALLLGLVLLALLRRRR